MPSKIKEVLIGDTFKQYWVSSGTTPSLISAAIINGAEMVVNSGTATSSGNGHYYRTALVNTPGWYVSEWKAVISGNPQKRRYRFKAILNEVD